MLDTRISDYPLVLFVVAFAAMTVAAWAGGFVASRRSPMKDDAREDFGLVQTATLTLLGLIIGFTFSMAVGRYDQRKNLEEEEANAIGTAYLRADLIGEPHAAKLKAQLRDYANERVHFYVAQRDDVAAIDARTAILQNDLWATVRAPALANPNPLTQVAVVSINDVINSQGYSQAAWWNRIPRAAWMLMTAIALCANFLVGFGARRPGSDRRLLAVLPLILGISFFLIADIDAPRGGVIRVIPQNLHALVLSLR